MPRHARRLAESGVYHVMLRGVNKDAVFLEDEDRERFLHVLGLAKEASGCVVLAYCLMTNHVHLVLQTPGEPISLVMKRLGVRYVGFTIPGDFVVGYGLDAAEKYRNLRYLAIYEPEDE